MNLYVPILVLGAIAVVFALFSVGVAGLVGPPDGPRAARGRNPADRLDERARRERVGARGR